jgi:hypothetical protein
MTYFKRQFIRSMWPIQLTFLILWLVGYSLSPCLYVIIRYFSHHRFKWSSPAFSSTTFQNLADISNILSEVANFRHRKKPCFKCSSLLIVFSNENLQINSGPVRQRLQVFAVGERTAAYHKRRSYTPSVWSLRKDHAKRCISSKRNRMFSI